MPYNRALCGGYTKYIPWDKANPGNSPVPMVMYSTRQRKDSDNSLYNMYGGKLWQAFILSVIEDSLWPIDPWVWDIKEEFCNRGTYRTLNTEEVMHNARDARLYALGISPESRGKSGDGQMAMSYSPFFGLYQQYIGDPSQLITWLVSAWRRCDKDPAEATRLRRLIRGARRSDEVG